jgi:hypothetical protein
VDFNISNVSRQDPRLQMVAVLKSGTRVHSDGMHFINHAGPADLRQLISFYTDLAEVEHFEIRPFGGRARFFFEAVTLPNVSSSPFVAPPVAKVQISGGEIEKTIAEFVPLKVSVATHRGEWAGGSRAGWGRVTITKSANVTNLDKSLSLIFICQGLRIRPNLQFYLQNQPSPVPASSLVPNGFQGGASTGNCEAACWTFRTPLDQVDAVDISLPTH